MEVLAWQFLPYDGRLRKPLPDGTRPRVTTGWSYHTNRTIEMQWRRLQAYPRPLDALMHGAGSVACRVQLGGTLDEYPRLRRLCGTDFTVLDVANVMPVLDRFAVDLAERTLLRERMAGREPSPAIWEALIKQQERLAGTRSVHPYEGIRIPYPITHAQWEAEPPEGRLPWRIWYTQKMVEWNNSVESVVFKVVHDAAFQFSTRPAFHARMRSIKEAIRAGELSRALWSEGEEAAAVAAGLRVQADEVNAELEARLIASLVERIPTTDKAALSDGA